MKVRYAVRCEWCRGWMSPGTVGTRFHKRIWHSACVADYVREREQAKTLTTTT